MKGLTESLDVATFFVQYAFPVEFYFQNHDFLISKWRVYLEEIEETMRNYTFTRLSHMIHMFLNQPIIRI
jgi:hypothetical protein